MVVIALPIEVYFVLPCSPSSTANLQTRGYLLGESRQYTPDLEEVEGMEEEGGHHAPGHPSDHVAHLQPHVEEPRGAAAVTHPQSLITDVTNKSCLFCVN